MRPRMKPQRNRAAGAHPTDRKMLYLLVGAVAVGLVLWMVASGMGSRDSEPVAKISVSWTALPAWTRGTEPDRPHASQRQKEPRTLAVYLDVSEPMGGFLPPPSRPLQPSEFRSVVLNLVPEQLARVSGSAGSPIEWTFVAAELQQVERPRTLTRGVAFNGGESRLNKAVTAILRGFDEGRLETAALITDLVSTDDLTGAMGVAIPLSDRMSSGSVRKGDFHLGLLGINAPYWGAWSRSCRPAGDLGCWFSEQAQRYKPLTRVAKVPFYILIMGRGFEPVQEIGEGIRAGAVQLGLEAQWEVLTEVSRERQLDEVTCTTHRAGHRREPQYALVRQEGGSVRCQREEEVEILCPLPKGARFQPQSAATSWPGVGAALEGKTVVLKVDCGALRASIPSGGLTVKVEGPPALDDSRWRNWSGESDEREDDLGRTLQLMSFLDKVRPKPERLEVTSAVLLERFGR